VTRGPTKYKTLQPAAVTGGAVAHHS